MTDLTPGAVPARATSSWLWHPPTDLGAAVAFAAARGVTDLAVSVPWTGMTPGIAGTVRAFRQAGVTVTALGSGTNWPLNPASAVQWAERATRDAGFNGLHLDVEFWTLPEFDADPDPWIRGFVKVLRLLRETVDQRVTVDLSAGLAMTHPAAFERCAAAASTVTLLAYRDRAEALLELAAAGRQLLSDSGLRYQLGVETQRASQAVPPHTTFGDDGHAVLDRELARAARVLDDDPQFRGWAVHHLTSWMELPQGQ